MQENQNEISTETKSLFQRLGPAGILGILWAILPAIAGFVLLANIGNISDWLQTQGKAGIPIFICLFAISAGLGLLPTYAQAILAGWVFGFMTGSIAAILGFTGAAIIGYAFVRLVSQNRVENIIRDNPKAAAIKEALVDRGFWRTLGIVTLIRIPPNSPFAITNLVMASSGVNFVIYTIGTIIGLAPRTAIAVFIAAATASSTGAVDIQTAIEKGKNLPLLIGGLVTMFIALGIIGMIANKAIEHVMDNDKRNNKDENDNQINETAA